MKSYRRFAWLAIAIGVVLIARIAFRSSPEEDARTASPAAAVSSPSGRPAPSSPSPAPGDSGAPRQTDRPRPLSDEELSTVEGQIDEAVVQYDASTLPLFSGWLSSHDPRVREAAKDGLLQAGLAGGAPLLRQTADEVSDPAEKQELLRAAEILELPPPDPEIVRQILEKAQSDGPRLPARRLKLRDLSPPGSSPAAPSESELTPETAVPPPAESDSP